MQASINNTSGLFFRKSKLVNIKLVNIYLPKGIIIFILNTTVFKVRILYIHNYTLCVCMRLGFGAGRTG